ncbi:DNA ligase [Catenovulum sp. SM1970]|uniref:DNA ligase n=1 Tax=Marinifaba aquimaris TaxID=2741323 RepID=UPI001573C7EA|nr:DNA ligase [Marinifaba aquimaris]NTS76888.1 DNA ligase [Marinifaba aquimaris]
MKIIKAIWFSLVLSCFAYAEGNLKPALTLASVYTGSENIKEYFVSEKYDGVRAYWNGRELLTRSGNQIITPNWFVASLPDWHLDAELWIDREQFDLVSGITRKKVPIEKEWRNVKLMIFDMHHQHFSFEQRYHFLIEWKKQLKGQSKHIIIVKQQRVENHRSLSQLLEATLARGGEGLMLKRIADKYQAGRSNNLIKVKKYQDAEAMVIKHIAGKGKYTGMLGALVVKDAQGRTFKIGTGFTVKERKHPPAIGTQVTYKYWGMTKNGLPRFASYLRQRPEH